MTDGGSAHGNILVEAIRQARPLQRRVLAPVQVAVREVLTFDPYAKDSDDDIASWLTDLRAELRSSFGKSLYREPTGPVAAPLEALEKALRKTSPTILVGERGSGKTTLLHQAMTRSATDFGPDEATNRIGQSRSLHYLNGNGIPEAGRTPQHLASQLVTEIRSNLLQETRGSVAATKFAAFLLDQGLVKTSERKSGQHTNQLVYDLILSKKWEDLESRYLAKTDAFDQLRHLGAFFFQIGNHTLHLVIDNVDLWKDDFQRDVAMAFRQLYEDSDGLSFLLAIRLENLAPVRREIGSAIDLETVEVKWIESPKPHLFIRSVVIARLDWLRDQDEFGAKIEKMVVSHQEFPLAAKERRAFYERTSETFSFRETVDLVLAAIRNARYSTLMFADLFENFNGSIRLTCSAVSSVFSSLLFGETRSLSIERLRGNSTAKQAHILRTIVLRHAVFYDIDEELHPPPTSMMLFGSMPTLTTASNPRARILEYLHLRVGRRDSAKLASAWRPRPRAPLPTMQTPSLRLEEVFDELTTSNQMSSGQVSDVLAVLSRRRSGAETGLVRVLDEHGRELISRDRIQREGATIHLLDAGDLLVSFLSYQTEYLFWSAAWLQFNGTLSAESPRVFDSAADVRFSLGSEMMVAVKASTFLREYVFPNFARQFHHDEDGPESVNRVKAALRRGRVLDLDLDQDGRTLEFARSYAHLFGSYPLACKAVESVSRHCERLLRSSGQESRGELRSEISRASQTRLDAKHMAGMLRGALQLVGRVPTELSR